MRKPSDNSNAVAAFMNKKAEIDAMLARMQALSGDHFDTDPETIHWGHVGTLSHYAELLKGITESAFQLVRCGRCSLVYQNPRVRPSSISKYYSGNYHSSRAGRKEAGAKPVARERRKCQIIEEPGIRPPGTVLDVGCTNSDLEVASGELLARTRRQGGMITVQARRP